MDVPNEKKTRHTGLLAEKSLALAMYGIPDCPAHSLVMSFLSREPCPPLAVSSKLS